MLAECIDLFMGHGKSGNTPLNLVISIYYLSLSPASQEMPNRTECGYIELFMGRKILGESYYIS